MKLEKKSNSTEISSQFSIVPSLFPLLATTDPPFVPPKDHRILLRPSPPTINNDCSNCANTRFILEANQDPLVSPVLFFTSYQVLNAGHVVWIYGDRIIEAILGLRKVLFKLKKCGHAV